MARHANHCDTCGKDVVAVLCPTCAKWWHDNPPPAEAEPVAWRAEYRDVYQHRDTGWHFTYSNTKPDPCALLKAPDGFEGFIGYKNVTPLYAHPPAKADQQPPDAASLLAEDVVEAAWEALKKRACADPDTAKRCVMVSRSDFAAALTPYITAREEQARQAGWDAREETMADSLSEAVDQARREAFEFAADIVAAWEGDLSYTDELADAIRARAGG